MYLRKMNKLAWGKLGGIDMEGYREYINNISQISKLNENFELSERRAPDGFNSTTEGWGELSISRAKLRPDIIPINDDMSEEEKLSI
jgi:hypothetical protein